MVSDVKLEIRSNCVNEKEHTIGHEYNFHVDIFSRVIIIVIIMWKRQQGMSNYKMESDGKG